MSDIKIILYESDDRPDQIALEILVLEGKRSISIHIQEMVILMISHVIGEYGMATNISDFLFVDCFDEQHAEFAFTLDELYDRYQQIFGKESFV